MNTSRQSAAYLPRSPFGSTRLVAAAALGLTFLFSLVCAASVHAQENAQSLRTKYNELQAELTGPNASANVFGGAPVHLDSSENGSRVSGEIYAVMDHPYAAVTRTFKSPANWCEVMILHLNTKYCRAAPAAGASRATLVMGIGGKKPEAAEKASRLDFAFSNPAASAEYLRVDLTAGAGPMGTSNYRITLEAIPVGPKKSFLHFSYSYEAGVAGRLAMKAYLATAGAGKIGFTVLERGADGQPRYVGGARGVVERNTMRYYLAIDAYLDSLSAPAADQLEARLQAWYEASEKYAKQLHEVDKTAYLEMKRDEVRRQQTLEISQLQ